MSNDDIPNIVLEDCQVLFRNFAGAEGQYNRAGDRNFCVIIDDNLAERLEIDGWNIKTLRSKDEDEPDRKYLQVSVGYKARPPLVVMLTSKGRTTLGEDEIEVIDWVEIDKIDLIIRPYKWTVSGKSGVKAYLKSFYVTIAEDALALKYADVQEISDKPPWSE
jgi:hypothetical protein